MAHVAYRTPYTRAPVVRGTGSPLPPFLSISPLELLERRPPSPPPSPRMVAIQQMICDLVKGTADSERVLMLHDLFALEPHRGSKEAAWVEVREGGEHSFSSSTSEAEGGEASHSCAWDEFVHWDGPPTPDIPTSMAAAENVEFSPKMKEHTKKLATQRSKDKPKKLLTRRSERIGARNLLHFTHSSDSSHSLPDNAAINTQGWAGSILKSQETQSGDEVHIHKNLFSMRTPLAAVVAPEGPAVEGDSARGHIDDQRRAPAACTSLKRIGSARARQLIREIRAVRRAQHRNLRRLPIKQRRRDTSGKKAIYWSSGREGDHLYAGAMSTGRCKVDLCALALAAALAAAPTEAGCCNQALEFCLRDATTPPTTAMMRDGEGNTEEGNENKTILLLWVAGVR
ncbi:hypothetical protein C8F04DRAFT_1302999 [Mycena alexandri]|uniref:Uncharacterized protein n=1 Tax=Mycena alexandri TaxID=1745969 RepID=A0AAD6SB93_9AGAR|nr:hypothetical protein C8F04DRAFT_1302999 [Mycena alexandri]